MYKINFSGKYIITSDFEIKGNVCFVKGEILCTADLIQEITFLGERR